jgi:peptide/nickel transport system substrate-binding protein
MGMAAGATLATPSFLRAQTKPVDARTVQMVMSGDLSVFDPMSTTAGITLTIPWRFTTRCSHSTTS